MSLSDVNATDVAGQASHWVVASKSPPEGLSLLSAASLFDVVDDADNTEFCGARVLSLVMLPAQEASPTFFPWAFSARLEFAVEIKTRSS